ncbi:MAG: hypothetical protein V4543_09310 [Bacteroidota bacterium]
MFRLSKFNLVLFAYLKYALLCLVLVFFGNRLESMVLSKGKTFGDLFFSVLNYVMYCHLYIIPLTVLWAGPYLLSRYIKYLPAFAIYISTLLFSDALFYVEMCVGSGPKDFYFLVQISIGAGLFLLMFFKHIPRSMAFSSLGKCPKWGI